MSLKHLLLSSVFLLTIGCAKQTSPTGGPKDETPPKLKVVTPENQTTNFKAEQIELEFDEQIQANNPREQIIITPNIGKDYELTVKKNKAILKLNSPLSDSTTYTINFRESIQDITEKNSAENLKYAFSTGSYIDSLSISGKVTNLLSDTPAKEYTVALAIQSDTFNIFKHPAQWLTITDKEGNFKIENLKPANYILYSIEDKNKNLIVDSKSESYGFKSNTIRLDSSLAKIELSNIKLDARELKLISAKPLTTYFNIKTTKSISSYKVEPVDSALTLYSQILDLTNVKIYNTINLQDSLLIRFVAQDSLENKIDTTLYLKFDSRSKLKEKFTSKIEYVNYHTNLKQLESKITFSKPVHSINNDSLYIELDSLNKKIFTIQELNWNPEQTQLTILKVIEEPVQKAEQKSKSRKETESESTLKDTIINKLFINKLFINKAAFISIEQDTLSPTSQPIKIISPQETGVILLEIKCDQNFIVQLIDQKLNVIKEIANNKTPKFENIQPGSYQIRLIIDSNLNGKWDAGNYFKREEPEKLIFYHNEKGEKAVNLKANWELGPLLISYE